MLQKGILETIKSNKGKIAKVAIGVASAVGGALLVASKLGDDNIDSDVSDIPFEEVEDVSSEDDVELEEK